MESVIVKAFRGVAINRWLIGEYGHLAVITNERGAEAVRRGEQPEFVLGFPKDDVFCHQTGFVVDGDTPDWSAIPKKF